MTHPEIVLPAEIISRRVIPQSINSESHEIQAWSVHGLDIYGFFSQEMPKLDDLEHYPINVTGYTRVNTRPPSNGEYYIWLSGFWEFSSTAVGHTVACDYWGQGMAGPSQWITQGLLDAAKKFLDDLALPRALPFWLGKPASINQSHFACPLKFPQNILVKTAKIWCQGAPSETASLVLSNKDCGQSGDLITVEIEAGANSGENVSNQMTISVEQGLYIWFSDLGQNIEDISGEILYQYQFN